MSILSERHNIDFFLTCLFFSTVFHLLKESETSNPLSFKSLFYLLRNSAHLLVLHFENVKDKAEEVIKTSNSSSHRNMQFYKVLA